MVKKHSPILITRPEPGATRSARRVKAMGFEPLVMPLQQICALHPEKRLAAADLVADLVTVTSANLFTFLDPDFVAELKHLPLFCVGVRTAEAAQRAGFSNIRVAAGDARALAALINGACPAPSRIVYLCARQRKPDLEDGLRAKGHQISSFEIYSNDDLQPQSDQIDEFLQVKPKAALVYSARAATRLSAFLQSLQSGIRPDLQFYCLSEAVAKNLPAGVTSFISDDPVEASLLALLGKGD